MLTEQDATRVDENLLRVARAQRADLRTAMLALEEALARPAPGRAVAWAAELHDALVDTAATFERHIAVTEGDAGFLAEIAEHSPRLINAVHQLEREHTRIRGELSATLDEVRGVRPGVGQERIEALREHVTTLMAALLRHRQHGADLVYEAHAVDIGGSD